MEAKLSRFASHITIAGRRIGPGEPCYIIAEAGVSHFGELAKAEQLIQLALSGGADVFKTQHYNTDLLIGPSSPEWRDRLRPKELPDEAIGWMQKRCQEVGIPFLCTPHEEQALEFLDKELNVPAFKIGSGELLNWPFLAKVARRGKPVIISTGMYQIAQIKDAINVMADNGCTELAVLHCVTSYPAVPEIINLRVMDEIRTFFEGPVGYSDHTEGYAIPLAAVALGANIVEKHITIDKNVPNAQDWKVSCDPDNLADFVAGVRQIEKAVGDGVKRISEYEQKSIAWARKSLTAARDIAEGEVITADSLLAQRPGTGIPPSEITNVIGRQAKIYIHSGSLIAYSMLN